MNSPVEKTQPNLTFEGHAKQLEEVAGFDGGAIAGVYNFENLGYALRFAELMARSGPMVPGYARGNPAICLALTMRALQMDMDPFALASLAYQAQSNGPIGYEAKVWVAALASMRGIRLEYEFDGQYQVKNSAAQSAKGNTTAKQTAVGDRRCTAWAMIDGKRKEYTSPRLDDIGIKNSPLWQNDPDQALAYYAGRAWVRRHEPGVMLGARTNEEIQAESSLRDISPKEDGFAGRANRARGLIEEKDQADGEDDKDQASGEDQAAAENDAGEDQGEAEPGLPLTIPQLEAKKFHAEGRAAYFEQFEESQCPHDPNSEAEAHWKAGFAEAMNEGRDRSED